MVGTVAAHLLHAPPPLVARGFTHCHRQRLGNRWFTRHKQRHLQSKENATNKWFCSVLNLFKSFCSLFLPVRFFFCRWQIWLLLSSVAAEATVEMGGGCPVRGEEKWHLRLKRETVGLWSVEEGRSVGYRLKGDRYSWGDRRRNKRC